MSAPTPSRPLPDWFDDDANTLMSSSGLWAPKMSDGQFDYLRVLAKTHAGIVLPDYKRNMVYRRVSKRLTALGLKNFEAYCNLIAGPSGDVEIEFFINALTTNKTEFFRENHHFEHLESFVLPDLRQRREREGNQRLRIWSAGCSSGQEPYSIAMTLSDAFVDLSRWDAKILATDIDTEMLGRCRKGVFPMRELLTVPLVQRVKHVDMQHDGVENGQIKTELRDLITFNQLNLHGAWPMKGKFDVIFCRNVIIYFDKVDQIRLFDRFADLMQDGAYLYIGHSESLYKVTERFRPIGQSMYQKIS
jgi:chemotaxis protein methyltransferase CheR